MSAEKTGSKSASGSKRGKAPGSTERKKNTQLSDEMGARLVVKAMFSTDSEAVCQEFGVSVRTLQRWRERAVTDARVAALVAKQKILEDEVFDRGLLDSARLYFEVLQHQAREALKIKAGDADFVKAWRQATGTFQILHNASTLRGFVNPSGKQSVRDPHPGAEVGADAQPRARAPSGAPSSGISPAAPGGTGPIH